MRIGRWATPTMVCAALWVMLSQSACSDCDLKIDTNSLPDGQVGVSYRAEVNSDCGGDTFFIQSGNLPPGIGIDDDGDVRGTPTLAGIYPFTLGVFDYGSDEQASRGLVITILPAP